MGWKDAPLVNEVTPTAVNTGVIPPVTQQPWKTSPLVGNKIPKTETKPDQYSGGLLPFSLDEKGEPEFDSNAGILGMIKRIIKSPRDYMEGKIDLNTKEGIGRLLETAMGFTPASVALRSSPTSLIKTVSKTPTQQELKTVTKGGYEKAADMGVEFNPVVVKKFAQDLGETLNAKSMLPEANPEVYGLLNHLKNQPQNAVAIRLQELNEYRKMLGKLAANPTDPAKQNTARTALSAFDEFLRTVDTANVLVRSPSAGRGTQLAVQGQAYPPNHPAAREALDTLTAARGNAAANFRSKRITDADKTIDFRSSAANSGRNRDNTTRQRLTSLLLNEKKMMGMNKAETEFMESIIKGGFIKNAARHIGNRLGGGGGLGQTFLMGLAGTAGAQTGSPLVTLLAAGAPLAVGNVARSTANQLSKKQIKMLDDMIRKRSPEFLRREAEAPLIKQGPMRNPEAVRSLVQGLVQGASKPDVPLSAGGNESDLLRSRWLEQMKRAGIPVT